MNVFRSRKKSIAEADGERPSFDKPPPMPAVPPVPSTRGRTIFRKKSAPEPKKEVDLATVLPSTDEFRTSLLLPNLSARFSMLREQDDPNTKIGKANDDSVLFPKRSSRMDLFGHGLSDIAEVSSINGSIRPPFANERDGYSSADGYGTDDDSNYTGNIMDRAKPGAGNKFFGGRQKVYKIPQGGHGSTRDLNAGSQDRPAGRPVYEEDISMSLFQALRAKEKERKYSEETSYFDERDERSSREQERDAKRATSSSTNSNPREGRGSTAATSIASQFGSKPSPVNTPGQERVGQKKRLYGQGLDQQIHDQQSSAVNRLNSISRGPSFPRSGSNGPTLSRSASNLNDKFRSSSPFSPVLRSGSPSPVAGFGGFDFGVNGSRSNSRGPEAVKQTPPLSPNGSSPVDPTLVAALEPNDVGKATASGAFNKPKTTFNEQQFAQRQLQLQEGRNTPPLRSLSRAESGSDVSNRLRNGSLASVQSGNSNRPPHIDTSRAASTNSNHRHLVVSPHTAQNPNQTYLADSSASEYDSEPESPEISRQSSDGFASRKTSEDIRFDSRKNSEDNRPMLQEIREEQFQLPSLIHSAADDRGFTHLTDGTPICSPASASHAGHPSNGSRGTYLNSNIESNGTSTLGSGLNDLVRGHLRSDSGASSIYPASPGLPSEEFGQPATNESFAAQTAQQNMSDNARQLLERANQLAKGSKTHDVLGGVREDKVQQILGGEAPRRSNDTNHAPWQDQLKMNGHARGASTETQKEREDFANELAERRKAVQDNLMRSMEQSSRSSSPSRNPEMSPAKNGGFSLLKKAPRVSGEEYPPKAMKMLGISSASPARGSPENGDRQLGRARAPSQTSDGRSRAFPGSGPGLSERSIGAERRERFFRKTSAPPQTQMFEKAPNASLPLPPGNHGFRSKSSPADQPMSFHPAGRARKYSPPNTKTPLGPASVSLQHPSARPRPSQERSNTTPRLGQHPASYFPPNTPDSATAGGFTTTSSLDSSLLSPSSQSYSTNSTPSSEQPPHLGSNSNHPAYLPSGNRPRNRSVSKHEISSPTFLSATSSQSTIDLPPGASLHNGMYDLHVNPNAPPLPPINPNRRRGRVEMTQNVMTAFGGISPVGGISSQPQSAHPDHEEHSTFSADDDEPKSARPRARLRKISSEGGSIAAKARHHALMREADSIPGTPRLPTQQHAMSGRSSRKNSESRMR